MKGETEGRRQTLKTEDRSTPAQPLLLSPGSSSAVRPVPTSRGAARHVIHSCTLVVRLLAFSLVYMNI